MKIDIALGKQAPDFVLNDLTGKSVRLSDYRGKKHLVLAFLRGFM
jgi:peroxiredoxin